MNPPALKPPTVNGKPPAPAAPARPAGRPSAPPPPSSRQANRVAKSFRVEPWEAKGEGEKVIVVSESGGGKTTLAAMSPDPAFIGLDDGARKIGDPRTGQPVMHVPGVESFDDLRDAIRAPGLFKGRKTLVIDTATKADELAEGWVVANMKTEKGGSVKSIEGFGWGKGYKHVQEAMRALLMDLDGLVRQGINVVLLCQESSINVPNAEGADFIQAGPKLTHNKQISVRLDFQEWADHVVRIGYLDTTVHAVEGARAGKIAQTADSTKRAIFTSGARHFFAKNRGVLNRETGIRVALPPVISFEDPTDDSFWRLLFPDQQQ